MKKKFIKLLTGSLLFCILVSLQGIGFTISIGDIYTGGGDVTIINNYLNNVVQNSTNVVQPIQLGLSNQDLVQFYVEGQDAYFSYYKSDAENYDTQDVLNRFKPSMLRGWNSRLNTYQYVLFGRYYQDYFDQPIVWRVLGVKDGRALLLSEYILDNKAFDTTSNEWNESDLKAWLNGTFYQDVFSQAEKEAIMDNGAIGKVFLLSRAEFSVSEYGFNTDIYSKDPNRSASASMYAYSRGVWNVKESDYTNYYARSKANNTNVDLVASSGKFVLAKIDRDNVGIRPAIWVNVNQLPLTNGDGGLAYPFQ